MKMLKTLLITVLVLCISGCQYSGHRLTKIESALSGRVQELNERVDILTDEVTDNVHRAQEVVPTIETVETNKINEVMFNLDQASNRLDLAKGFERRETAILGQSSEDQAPMVKGLQSSNVVSRNFYELKNRLEMHDEGSLLDRKVSNETTLRNRGMIAEEAHNEKVWFWSKLIGIPTLLFGGLAALLVFCPPVAGFAVSLFPSLAGIFRIIPHSVGAGLVKAIGDHRSELQSQVDQTALETTRNPQYVPITYTAQQVLDMIDKHLDNHVGAADKVVNYLRDKNNV